MLNEQRGTCSTKHILLKRLADENGFNINLVMGLFMMTALNTPQLAKVFAATALGGLPGAHTYLRLNGKIIDATSSNSQASQFENDLIEEMVVTPDELIHSKIHYHQQFLRNWLAGNKLACNISQL